MSTILIAHPKINLQMEGMSLSVAQDVRQNVFTPVLVYVNTLVLVVARVIVINKRYGMGSR